MYNEIKEILDYISDRVIQKEKWNKVKDYIINLQQENERLKEENKYLDELRNANYLSWQDSLSRIEKAKEYIKVAKEQDFMWTPIFMKELLNILNGRSDE